MITFSSVRVKSPTAFAFKRTVTARANSNPPLLKYSGALVAELGDLRVSADAGGAVISHTTPIFIIIKWTDCVCQLGNIRISSRKYQFTNSPGSLRKRRQAPDAAQNHLRYNVGYDRSRSHHAN